MPRRSKKIDFGELRAIPILHVAEKLGMDLVPQGSGVWAMRDPQNPRDVTSLRIFESSNRFKRFSGVTQGGTSAGSTIDLCMHIRGWTMEESVDFLLPMI